MPEFAVLKALLIYQLVFLNDLQIASLSPNSSSQGTINVTINNNNLLALVDTGSAASFIDKAVIQKLNIPIEMFTTCITMASSSKTMHTEGICYVDLYFNEQIYHHQKFHVLTRLCVPLILGRDFMGQHKSINFQFNGHRESLTICSLQLMDITPIPLFKDLSPNI